MSYVSHPFSGRSLLNGQRGFTLIELMIVVVIIGIIAAIAYPSYTRYVERSRLTDGQSGLMQAASEMERCYTSNYSYEVDCLETGQSPEEVYPNITLTDSGSAYRLEAQNGTRVPAGCETLWIQSDGQRGPNGSDDSEDCW
ncbi:type IV pilin protein [Halovibrio sp. HP20-50]|uniref:type IV pilin protein n=1 Tax=Halovibrio sp. HP20-59 TaxID=3080275 RepID=UPI00294AE220|nr:type IV pilin protein [Halovibrio sp. HP20-59]MEA2120273.1 type IV pilin protein [Halovibrio sp. HP20-59]